MSFDRISVGQRNFIENLLSEGKPVKIEWTNLRHNPPSEGWENAGQGRVLAVSTDEWSSLVMPGGGVFSETRIERISLDERANA